ncbi:hypothetical protein LZK52_08285, partial [Pseudomonas aeruginosa]|nr:hypothetical protein [Pseudomonas aeruginosa]
IALAGLGQREEGHEGVAGAGAPVMAGGSVIGNKLGGSTGATIGAGLGGAAGGAVGNNLGKDNDSGHRGKKHRKHKHR